MGDRILQEVALRIQKFCKQSSVVARLGGDEFIVLSREFLYNEHIESAMIHRAEELLSVLKEPYLMNNKHLYLSASIGVSHISKHSLSSNNFFKEADIAMYEAKKSTNNSVIMFNTTLENSMNQRLNIEQKLYTALREKKIVLFYQVQVDKNSNMIGCEVLARWHDDELGDISPNEFIPIAESTGFIIELGMYILS